MFIHREDYRLKSAHDVIFHVLKDSTSDAWGALLHLTTSPVPQVGKLDPRLVGQGLGLVGNYEICDGLWNELARVEFETSVSEFSLPCDVYSPTREDMVLPMVLLAPDCGDGEHYG